MLAKILKTDFLIKYVFVAGIFFSPFIFWPSAYIAYEIPRVIFLERYIEILIIFSLIVGFKHFKNKPLNNQIIIFMSLYLLIILISIYTSRDLLKSLIGNYYRRDGLLTYLHLFALFYFLALFWQKSWQKIFTSLVSISSFIISLWTCIWGILLILGNSQIPNWEGAIGISFGQPNFLAGFLLVTIPFIIYNYKNSHSKILKTYWIFALILQSFVIFFTKSTASILINLIYLSLILLYTFHKSKPRLLIAEIFILLLISFIFVVQYFQKISPGKNFIAESRIRIYTKGFLGFTKRPLVGWGWANFDYAFEAVDWPIKLDKDVYVDRAHSQLLEILTTTGILGFIIYISLIFTILKTLLKSKSAFSLCLLSSFVLYLLHAQTNVISIAEELYFWIISGITATLPQVWAAKTPQPLPTQK